MAGYKNCRSAKTAEEERDKAVFYAENNKNSLNQKIYDNLCSRRN